MKKKTNDLIYDQMKQFVQYCETWKDKQLESLSCQCTAAWKGGNLH